MAEPNKKADYVFNPKCKYPIGQRTDGIAIYCGEESFGYRFCKKHHYIVKYNQLCIGCFLPKEAEEHNYCSNCHWKNIEELRIKAIEAGLCINAKFCKNVPNFPGGMCESCYRYYVRSRFGDPDAVRKKDNSEIENRSENKKDRESKITSSNVKKNLPRILETTIDENIPHGKATIMVKKR